MVDRMNSGMGKMPLTASNGLTLKQRTSGLGEDTVQPGNILNDLNQLHTLVLSVMFKNWPLFWLSEVLSLLGMLLAHQKCQV